MKEKKTTVANGTSRRKFLSLGFLGGAALFGPGKATGQMISETTDDSDTVPMLTPDGKLVEVPRRLVEGSPEKQKANNAGILSWLKSDHHKTR